VRIDEFDPFDRLNHSQPIVDARAVCRLRPSEGRACTVDEMQPSTNLHYFYSLRDRKCKLYFYKGCGGNGNRFAKKSICESLCAGLVRQD